MSPPRSRPTQVCARAERLGVRVPRLLLGASTEIEAISAMIDDVRPRLVVVDSIQTVQHSELASAPGSVTQVRDCAQRLVSEAKAREIATVLIGHVTKDGNLAGPRTLGASRGHGAVLRR